MPSNNPAFSRFNGSGNGPAGRAVGHSAPRRASQYGAPTQYDPYAAPSPYAATTTRYMTMDDVVTKTGHHVPGDRARGRGRLVAARDDRRWGLALPAILVGLVLGLVISFKAIANPAATLAYAAIEGVFLGAISEAFDSVFGGIVMQAVIGTFGVFAGMLVVYKTGAIRVTPKFTRLMIGALVGVLVLMLSNLVACFVFADGLGLRDGGPLAIVFSLVVIGVAAFSLLLDFDMADEAIRRGAPAKFAWYIAFGLLVTVVWLYLEILRLLSYFRD